VSPQQALRRFLATRHESQARFLAALVQQPSDNPPGDCKPHAELAARLLEQLGFSVERCPVPEKLVRAAGMVSAMNLVVRERFGDGGPTVALNAHGDVVPPGLGWTVPPYSARVADGFMYGRGVAVSKSDFATYAFALLALKSLQIPLKGAVELHFTYDEEAGGEIGPKWLLDQEISKPDYAICAGFSYDITTAHNGCLHLEVEITGKSAHAARPESGTDALEAAADIISELYALRKSYAAVRSRTAGIESPTLVIGLISGGINTNVVPDNVKFRIDRRIIPDEDPLAAERTLEEQLRGFARKWPGIECRLSRVLLAAPFTPVPGQERLVALLRKHARAVMAEDLPARGVPLYTDARHYSAAGIPTVLYGAGPRSLLEANGHRADEKLKLEDLYNATQVIALSLLDLLA
jgi:succinyl-diaminopimelate desuccinylase